MYKYRISKYNPLTVDENGDYKEDWTAISDIGKSFDGETLTVAKYVEVEDSYIKLNRNQLPYFLQNIELQDCIYNGIKYFKCKISMPPLDLEILSKDLIVLKE